MTRSPRFRPAHALLVAVAWTMACGSEGSVSLPGDAGAGATDVLATDATLDGSTGAPAPGCQDLGCPLGALGDHAWFASPDGRDRARLELTLPRVDYMEWRLVMTRHTTPGGPAELTFDVALWRGHVLGTRGSQSPYNHLTVPDATGDLAYQSFKLVYHFDPDCGGLQLKWSLLRVTGVTDEGSSVMHRIACPLQ